MAVTQIGTLIQFTTGNNAVADLNSNLSLITTQFNNLVTASNTLISGLTIPSPTISGACGGIAPGFVSAETAIPASLAVVTVAHGLGAVPRYVWARLRCKTGELGYSAGDEVTVTPGDQASANSGIWADATNVGFGLGATAGPSVYARSTNTMTAITVGNWKLVFYAIL